MDPRVETLDALRGYVGHHRASLARLRADIDRLKRRQAGRPLAEYGPARALLDDVHWDLFAAADPTPMRTLAVRTRIAHTQRALPAAVQQSPPSLLQRFVKDARRLILDPVLDVVSPCTDPVPLPAPPAPRPRHHAPTLTLPADPPPEPEPARSDTYKLPWSVSEQHLLERLLVEIPDGERNRWAKISHAMGGRRTPRQVASRVQKYVEKLRRFGVDTL